MLRYLPSVNDQLAHPLLAELVDSYGRSLVTNWVRASLDAYRAELIADQEAASSKENTSASSPAAAAAGEQPPNSKTQRELASNEIAQRVQAQAAQRELQHVQRVINATGVVLHTSLGRSPLSAAARQAILDASGACNVEVDVETGGRRYRGYQLEQTLQILTGCESSLIVNNNAAATMLTLQALCHGKEVVISRGELIEIGGSFRLPEIFGLSGAILKEIGTTNRTRLEDYEAAIGPNTAAVMHVHPSNYRVIGFTDKPDPKDIFAIGKKHGAIAIDDIGSGALFDVQKAGLPAEPTFTDSIQAGADVVLGSGDKLLGGPQSGIIIGEAGLISKMRSHALARAVRVDKLTLAALDATLDSYLRGAAETEVPLLGMLQADRQSLQDRAENVLNEIGLVDNLRIVIRDDVAQVGGGSLPAEEMPTVVLGLTHDSLNASDLMRQLRVGRICVFGRVQHNEVILDLRSVPPEDDARLALAVRLVRDVSASS
jgi:L-seryl-tRNA(Ser) seleniumtransferase